MQIKKFKLMTTALMAFVIGFVNQHIRAQENLDEIAGPAGVQELAPLTLIGNEADLIDLPGAGFYIDENDIRKYNDLSINRVFQKIPGVYVREETGFGNFPNISIRGGDGTRSENITIMEDGIPSAPAPYSSPSAYYSPNAARMSGLEVLKGSSQVKYGPHSTGGVINYLSTPIPDSRTLYIRSTYGSFNTTLNQIYYGNVVQGDHGKLGYLTEFYYKGSDGFRVIDPAPGYSGSDNTGFDMYEPMFKIFWEPKTRLNQRLEFKYGYTDFTANETYVGLSEQDLNQTPYRRYAGTLFDNMSSQQNRTYLKWIMEPNDDLLIENSLYYNDFSRNWYKIRRAGGQSIHRVLASPTAFANEFAILQMQAPGSLSIRANARDYYAAGYQSNVSYHFDTGEFGHTIDIGGRYHFDEVRRFQRDDTITVFANGVAPAVAQGVPGSGGNRVQNSDALSLYIQDSVVFRNITLSPGVRYEYIDMKYTDFLSDNTNTIDRQGSGSTDIVAPGIGVNYKVDEGAAVFAGAFKGISAPSPRSYVRSGVNWEESIGYETGVRYQSGAFYGELSGYLTDYKNITGSDAGLGGSNSSNAGEATVKGVELLSQYDVFLGEEYVIPLFFSGTYTDAILDNALSSGGGDDIFSGGLPGAEIPYIPKWQMAFGIGLETDDWTLNISSTYHSDSFGTAANSELSSSSSRLGKIDGGWISDFSYSYAIKENLRLFGGIQNLFDTVLTTSRIPEGPRVNSPRMFYLGFEAEL